MPTRITRPVTRETDALVHEQGKTRNVVVTLEPRTLALRLKGTRRSFTLDLVAAYHAAVKAEVSTRQREKRRSKRRH